MIRFHPLEVTQIHKTIRDAVVISLKPEDDSVFEFTQGQYLTFRRDFDNEELRRSYSICSSRSDGILQVGIKKVDGGAFSTWANSELKVGDIVEAIPPMGNFFAKSNTDNPHYLAFAAGSGITPLLSILKTGLKNEPNARFTLVYANKNPNTIMFREELEDLKNEHMARLNILHILTEQTQGIDLFQGRIDKQKCEQLFKTCIDIKTVNMAYICGPEPMMMTVVDTLKEHGLATNKIRFELFAGSQPGKAKHRVISKQDSKTGIPAQVIIGGETRNLTIQRDKSLLESALENNLDAPFACKSGVCSTCKARVLDGEVEMIANHALEDYEVEAGFVLSCQCYPLSENIVWDYDQSGH